MRFKTPRLLILVLLLKSAAIAQISIDSSDFPRIGDQHIGNQVAFDSTWAPSPSGPNEYYDFSGGFIFSGSFINYDDASSTPFASLYPNSTISRYIPANPDDPNEREQYLYYDKDPNAYWQNGMTWIGYLIDTLTKDTFNFTYSPTLVDTLLSDQYVYGNIETEYSVAALNIFIGPTPVDVYFHKLKDIEVGGWGTMDTPYGSYDDILRVKVTEYKYDSIFVNNVLDSESSDTLYYYWYLLKGTRHPLVVANMVQYGVEGWFVHEILNIPPPPVVVYGCIDTAAINYNPLATNDDSTCIYCSPINYTITPNTEICAGGSITLSVSGGTSYLWSTGDATATITVSPDTTTVYSVYINESQFCWELGTVEVTVFGAVKAAFWSSAITNTDSTSFINLSEGATNFFWDFGDSTTSIEQNPTHLYTSLGTRTIRLIASNICFVDTFDTTVNVVLGTSDIEQSNIGFNIFPNPGDKNSVVSYQLDKPADVEISIIDLMGRTIIIEKKTTVQAGKYSTVIGSDREFKEGVYIIRMKVNDLYIYKKWIKQG